MINWVDESWGLRGFAREPGVRGPTRVWGEKGKFIVWVEKGGKMDELFAIKGDRVWSWKEIQCEPIKNF